MIVHEDGTVTLTAEEYGELTEDQDFLDCLRAAGVDDWVGYEFAIEAFREMYPDEDD